MLRIHLAVRQSKAESGGICNKREKKKAAEIELKQARCDLPSKYRAVHLICFYSEAFPGCRQAGIYRNTMSVHSPFTIHYSLFRYFEP
jgi:hypothetical protein